MRLPRISKLINLPYLAVVLGALTDGGGAVRAHGLETALTTIEYNQQTDLVEVVHRIFSHDLESALERHFEADVDLAYSERTDRMLAEYLKFTFSINQSDGAVVPLTWIGFEQDGDTIWIYQETKGIENTKSIRIRNTMLMNDSTSQLNTVNVFLNNIEETLIFRNGDHEQEVPPD